MVENTPAQRALVKTVQDECGIPWNSYEQMNRCMDEKPMRGKLIDYFSGKGFTKKAAGDFLDVCFTDTARQYLNTNK